MTEPIIFDTTLREGFQTPGGIGATLEERMYAAALIQNYAHWVELGMPANPVDYPIIGAIRDRFLLEKYPVGIAVLARCNELDIGRSAEVMANYPNSLIHLFIGTSPEHRNLRFGGRNEDFYKTLIRDSVMKAAQRGEFSRVMFSPEDSYRTFKDNPENLSDFITAAMEGYEAGNKNVGRKNPMIFNLPDTVGYSTISEFSKMIEFVQKRFNGSIDLSVHCHNDSGMANAQAIHMFEVYGVNWIQSTFAQLGERNGIASTDLIIKILSDRGMLTDSRIIHPDNLARLDPVTKAIMWTLGRQVPDEHGYRTNVSTAGIHTDLAIKSADAYHIRGNKFGSRVYMELGPTSGSKQVIELLDANDIPYDKGDKSRIESFTDRLKDEANKRKAPLSDTYVLYEAFKEFCGKSDDGLIIEYLETTTATARGKTEVLIRGTIDGKSFIGRHTAGGPVDTTIRVLNETIMSNHPEFHGIELESYSSREIARLGREYLDWPVGTAPNIPLQIGKDADLAIRLSLINGSGVYHGWHRGENSTLTEVRAVIDTVQKMYALQKWMPKTAS